MRPTPDVNSSRGVGDRSSGPGRFYECHLEGQLLAHGADMQTLVGIDRVHLSVPIGCRADDESWDRRYGRKRSSVVNVGDAKVNVWSGNGRDGLLYIGADFNPSRVLDADPLYVCEVSKLAIAVEEVWPEVAQRSDADDDWRVARVQRLDITRDFRVSEPVRVIEALSRIPRPRVKQQLLYQDPGTTRTTGLKLSTSGAEHVGVGRRGQAITLYDKGRRLGRSDLMIVRWEARCQTWTREIGRITYGFELSADRIDQLAWNRWNWSAMGTAMAGERTLVDAVLSLGLSPTETEALIGHATLRANGHGLQLSKGTRKSRRERMDQLGAVLARGNPYPWGSRLDFVLGREVPADPPDEEVRL